MNINLKQTLGIVKDIAVEVGGFQVKKLGKIKDISYKSRINLVTEVDIISERLIIKRLKSEFHGFLILSEETGGSYKIDSSFKWVIDPLDGTTNYAHSFPFFSISIALEKNSQILLGLVYDPLRKELFSAIKNNGAFCNNNKIRVSSINSIQDSLLATGFPYKFGKGLDRNLRNFKNFLKNAQAIRRAGSAALDLCYVACGRFDGYWELGLHPWDTPAGAIIVTEAGGNVTDFDGRPFNHYKKEILASNFRIHSRMMQILS